MDFPSIIATLVLLAIVVSAISYVVKQKRKGTVCIGCPVTGSCSKKDLCSPMMNVNDGGRTHLPIAPVSSQTTK
ncbi:FeoB-associated Cys-rich membrane protein [Arcanobacterium phocae]|uniref:FeoB-associated Cys-rich membrane protein n=1 Tax=Arcanobacterium phocae TaxID=131112 RepID=UPI001C0F0E68|nr:FeoB-associated Cys-rich membrane protein [Arcanobacterium phocae]